MIKKSNTFKGGIGSENSYFQVTIKQATKIMRKEMVCNVKKTIIKVNVHGICICIPFTGMWCQR